MTIAAGTRLGPYEITALIGEGGMGRVFRARDTRLKRDVAIKSLPDIVSRDADRLARFEREAEALAALNHPHIAGIYNIEEVDGRTFLILELVEGQTLAEKLGALKKGLPIPEALDTATQIAEAIEAAHERGIVHRDLKPANVKITPDGRVKILDFGLAKVRAAETSDVALSQSPTLMTMANVGSVMGTAAYMSPEQAKGKDADRSSDVWAFGCVLYEMLTGRPVFEGETVGEVLAEVFKAEPDWSRLPANTPAAVRRLLRRCLQKDKRQRLHDIADARIEIDDARTEPIAPAAAPTSAEPMSRHGSRRGWIAAAMASVAAVGFAAAWIGAARPPAPEAPEMRVEIATPSTPDPLSFAISPDGQMLVFVAASDGQPRLWIRPLGRETAQLLGGTEGATYPFWSPDNKSVAFFADNRLKQIDVASGVVEVLATASAGRGGAWSRAGAILFSPSTAGPIYRLVPHGEPVAVTRVDRPRQSGHRFPQFLSDGKHFVYYAKGQPDASGIYLADLDGTANVRLAEADTAAVVASTGHLLFARQGTLFAQALDSARQGLAGSPYPLTPAQLLYDGAANVAAVVTSAAGLLAYRAGGGSQGSRRQLTWFDRSGGHVTDVGAADATGMQNPSLSPDGRHVAVDRAPTGTADIWLIETARGALSRMTFDPAEDRYPIWSFDGSRIFFTSNRKGKFDLYETPSNSPGGEVLLLESPEGIIVPVDVSRDGRFLLARVALTKTGRDLWAVPLHGDRKPFPVAQTPFEEREGQFSPDGKWVAFQSDESGRFEIYVRPFPGPGPSTPVSIGGGTEPRWRGDGQELFFLSSDAKLMAVTIHVAANGQAIEAATPTALFQTHIVGGAVPGTNAHQYIPSADGRRFLINTLSEDVTTSPITLVLNWKPPATAK